MSTFGLISAFELVSPSHKQILKKTAVLQDSAATNNILLISYRHESDTLTAHDCMLNRDATTQQIPEHMRKLLDIHKHLHADLPSPQHRPSDRTTGKLRQQRSLTTAALQSHPMIHTLQR